MEKLLGSAIRMRVPSGLTGTCLFFKSVFEHYFCKPVKQVHLSSLLRLESFYSAQFALQSPKFFRWCLNCATVQNNLEYSIVSVLFLQASRLLTQWWDSHACGNQSAQKGQDSETWVLSCCKLKTPMCSRHFSVWEMRTGKHS